MICDSHVHLKHGDAARTEYSPDTIVRTMDAVGIDRSVVFAMATTTRRSIRMAEAAARRFPDRLIPYVYALPSYERRVVDELAEALCERGFRGIKLHAGECRLAGYVVDPVFELAGRCGAPCLVDFAGDSAAAQRLAARFPQTTVLVAHLGKYLCTDGRLLDRFISLAEAHQSMYLDVSGVAAPAKVAEAVARVGSNRVVWGSDGPHEAPDTVGFARRELAKVEALGLSEGEKADLLGGAIAGLLGL